MNLAFFYGLICGAFGIIGFLMIFPMNNPWGLTFLMVALVAYATHPDES